MALTETEKSVPYSKYYNKKLPAIPDDVMKAIHSGPIDSTEALLFENINDLLKPGYHARENGYCQLPNGIGYVSVLTNMPEVTGEMIEWWFWWHALENLRYKIWHPEAHLGISVENRIRMLNAKLSYPERYLYNSQYPIENIGRGVESFSIRFVSPQDFGFDEDKLKKAGVATIICGVIGTRNMKIQHSVMCHFVRKKGSGIEMRSRFWLGRSIRLKNKFLNGAFNNLLNSKLFRNGIIGKKTPYKMAQHCAQEYNNLAEILPELYRDYGGDN